MSINTVIHGKATHTIFLNARSNNGGAFTQPDNDPIVTHVHVNGVVASSDPITITQLQDSTPANITGRYQAVLDLTATGFDSKINDTITIDFETIINGNKAGQTVVVAIEAAQVDKPSLEAQ